MGLVLVFSLMIDIVVFSIIGVCCFCFGIIRKRK